MSGDVSCAVASAVPVRRMRAVRRSTRYDITDWVWKYRILEEDEAGTDERRSTEAMSNEAG
jgi:hypothetical protein